MRVNGHDHGLMLGIQLEQIRQQGERTEVLQRQILTSLDRMPSRIATAMAARPRPWIRILRRINAALPLLCIAGVVGAKLAGLITVSWGEVAKLIHRAFAG